MTALSRKMPSLDLPSLRQAYLSGAITPAEVLDSVDRNIEAWNDPAVWIHFLTPDERAPHLKALAGRSPEELPLYGVPFAIKDNIDLADIDTTAGCPAYAYRPQASAFVVECLVQAGAIPIGKTNLDQFATGLVGTRSPYGIPRNALQPDRVPGGSSSGSAVAVAAGLVSFALGTDTAGSGRVPAAFNNIVGLKPTRGLLSTRGVVPACRTLDCVSIFSLTCADAQIVFRVVAAHDAASAWSRPLPWPVRFGQTPCRVGIPQADQLEFFGDKDAARAFESSLAWLREGGIRLVEIEIWELTEEAFGSFVSQVPRPLCIGKVETEQDGLVSGFLCEPEALHGARDITDLGSWRRHVSP